MSERARRLRRRRLVLAGISGLCGAFVALSLTWALRPRAAAPAGAVVSGVLHDGSTAPVSFALAPLSGGRPVSLSKELGGHLAVVNFFASWCQACASELRAFASVSSANGAKVRFVGIDTNDANRGLARQLLAGSGVRYPVFADTASAQVASAYGLYGLPATFFLDRSGRVVSEVLGIESRAALAARVAGLEHSA